MRFFLEKLAKWVVQMRDKALCCVNFVLDSSLESGFNVCFSNK